MGQRYSIEMDPDQNTPISPHRPCLLLLLLEFFAVMACIALSFEKAASKYSLLIHGQLIYKFVAHQMP